MEIAKLVLSYLQTLIWPIVTLIIVYLFREPLKLILSKIEHASVGKLSFDLKQEINDAQKLSEIVEVAKPSLKEKKHPTIPLTEANSRLLDLGLQPSPSGLDLNYYLDLADNDPTLALAGLRIEVEVLTRNLVKGFALNINLNRPVSILLRELYKNNNLSSEQFDLTMKILQICNAAVHGRIISRIDAASVINIAKVLAEQYLEWLSWNFADGWKPRENKKEISKGV